MRLAHLWLGLSAALFLAACGGDDGGPTPPEPLEITSLTPAPDAADVETGATVAVVFNQAIDPATLTSATFQVKRSGVPLPTALSYEAATRTARAAAPLLPDVTYEVEVTTGVRTPADSALSAARVWSFTTREWQAATVDAAGEVGRFTSLALEASGQLHVTYYDDTNGDLKYATCAANCTTAANWQAGTVDAAGNVGVDASLAVDGIGRLHVSYYDDTNVDLKYATCAANCATAASWQAVTVDGAEEVGRHTSLTLDASGRLHVSYWDLTNNVLKYATCAANCATAANWQAATADAAGEVGRYTSLAVDGSGRLHVIHYDLGSGDVKYATCAANCDATANWQAGTVDATGDVGIYISLAVDGSGRLHVSYFDVTNADLKYATCGAGCATPANWQAATVDADGIVGEFTSLAVDGSGRLHVSYFDETNGDLKYATCAASCATAANWRAAPVDVAGSVGLFTSLVVDGSGRVHVSYYDNANFELRYIE